MEKQDAHPRDPESGREGIPHWTMILDQGVVTKEVAEWEYDGEGTEDDPYVVEWIENDARNPQHWAKTKKWIIALAVANSVLVVSFCSSAFSGGIQQIMVEFSVSQEVVTLGVSLFVLGFALGYVSMVFELGILLTRADLFYGRRSPSCTVAKSSSSARILHSRRSMLQSLEHRISTDCSFFDSLLLPLVLARSRMREESSPTCSLQMSVVSPCPSSLLRPSWAQFLVRLLEVSSE